MNSWLILFTAYYSQPWYTFYFISSAFQFTWILFTNKTIKIDEPI